MGQLPPTRTQGLPTLRTALADYLGRTRGVIASADRIVVCSGYVQGLALLARVLADSGRGVIALEDPGLPHHRATVRHAGAHVVPLPVDHLGARTDPFPGPAFDGVGAVVVTAAHQYPTGAPLTDSQIPRTIPMAP